MLGKCLFVSEKNLKRSPGPLLDRIYPMTNIGNFVQFGSSTLYCPFVP